jgi:hypothetical protein
MEQRDISRKGEMMLARCGVKRGWRRPEEDHASQGIRRPRWLARAGRIGKLLEKQRQLRPGDIFVRAETGQIVHAGARFEFERQANQLRFIKEKSWLTRVPRRGALNKPY